MQNFILLKVIQQEKIRIKHLETQISHSQIIKDISLSFLYMFLPGRMSFENEFRKYDCVKTEKDGRNASQSEILVCWLILMKLCLFLKCS